MDDLRIKRRPETAGASKSWPAAVAVVVVAVLAGAAVWWRGRAEAVEVRTVPARATGGSGGGGADGFERFRLRHGATAGDGFRQGHRQGD